MSDGCWNCAYSVRENGQPVYCRFHCEEVTQENVCDDYLNFLDAPAAAQLFSSRPLPKLPFRNRVKDALAWVIIAVFTAAGVLAFLYC